MLMKAPVYRHHVLIVKIQAHVLMAKGLGAKGQQFCHICCVLTPMISPTDSKM